MNFLKDLTEKIGSGATPRGGKNAYQGGNFSLIRSQNVLDFQFSFDGLAKINDEQAKALSNVEVLDGDVLLNITGDSVARCCQVDAKSLPARVNQHVCIIRPKKDKLDARFLKYLLLEPNYKNFLLTLASAGATRNALTKGMVEELEIPQVDVTNQKAIAHILGTLDDKIELNQKMNQTLEEIAKAIFKSWFVDFDPVRAKAEGRPTGLPPEISDLFPDELVDSEIGEIPKGWQTSTFADVLEIQGGFAFKSKDFGEDGDRVIKIKNIRGDGTVDQFDCDRVANADKKLDRFLLRDGDAVIAMTGATVGKVGLMSVNDEKFYLNQRVGRLLPKSSSDRCWYSVLLLSSEKTKDFIEGYAYGSAQPNISSKDIASIPNLTPCSELVESFNQIVSPLFLRTLIILKENDLLSELRDTLLPKLISGELRIPDAEKFLEEAGI
jgi:type I restriction enzyme S subunit